jgi:hypothetical protein
MIEPASCRSTELYKYNGHKRNTEQCLFQITEKRSQQHIALTGGYQGAGEN